MVETRSNGRNLRSKGQPPGKSLSQMKAGTKKKPGARRPVRKAEKGGKEKTPTRSASSEDNDDGDPAPAAETEVDTERQPPGGANFSAQEPYIERLGPMDSISGSQVPPPPTTRCTERQRHEPPLPPVPSVVIPLWKPPREKHSTSTTIGPASRTALSSSEKCIIGPASRTVSSSSENHSRSTTIGPVSRTLSMSRSSVTAHSVEHVDQIPAVLSAILEEEEHLEDQQAEEYEGGEEGQDKEDEEEEDVVPHEQEEEEEQVERPLQQQRYLEDEQSLVDFSEPEPEPEHHQDEGAIQLEQHDNKDWVGVVDDDEERSSLRCLTWGSETPPKQKDGQCITNEDDSVDREPRPPQPRQTRPPRKKHAPRETAVPPPAAKAKKKKTSSHDIEEDEDHSDAEDEDDDDDDSDDKGAYTPGPLPDWAGKRATECYEAYYNEMLKIAADAKWSPQLVFSHVNDIAPIGERPDVKPDNWTPQQWTQYISEQYNNEVAWRLPDKDDRNDPEKVQEAMG
ncbi:hypothetical protein V5O48_011078 [Marasmius crinis-equi]|uniref:Uncharacterized protein n=1 Tax=Marasmius crinis-equi TaxID=585013 RepID=A0ABR3F6K6_9AGAR